MPGWSGGSCARPMRRHSLKMCSASSRRPCSSIARPRVFSHRAYSSCSLAEDARIDRQGLPRQRFRGGGIALGVSSRPARLPIDEGGVGMIRAEDAQVGGEVLAQQALGAGEIAAPHAGSARGRSCWWRFRGARRRRPRGGWPAPRGRAARPRRRLPCSRSARDSSTSVIATSGCRGPSTWRRIAMASRSRGSALRRLAQLAVQHAEVVEALREPGVGGTERAAAGGDRLLEQRQRLVEASHALEGAADHREHLGLQLRLVGELARHAIGAAIEQALRRSARSCPASDTDRRR